MTDEDAIDILKNCIADYVIGDYCTGKHCIDENMCKYEDCPFHTAIDTVTELIEKQQAEIEKYKEMYAVSIADRVNSAFKQEHKNNEDLEMLYKGCQIELEKKDKIIDEMAKIFINSDYCFEITDHLKCNECINKNKEKQCEKCIKEYFKKKVEGK